MPKKQVRQDAFEQPKIVPAILGVEESILAAMTGYTRTKFQAKNDANCLYYSQYRLVSNSRNPKRNRKLVFTERFLNSTYANKQPRVQDMKMEAAGKSSRLHDRIFLGQIIGVPFSAA
ncbi:MAG: hypothetical protein ABFD11_13655 [Christensenella sp.]